MYMYVNIHKCDTCYINFNIYFFIFVTALVSKLIEKQLNRSIV